MTYLDSVGLILLGCLLQRTHSGPFGSRPMPPKCVFDDLRHAGQYALEAPDLIPAGAMRAYAKIPTQILVSR